MPFAPGSRRRPSRGVRCVAASAFRCVVASALVFAASVTRAPVARAEEMPRVVAVPTAGFEPRGFAQRAVGLRTGGVWSGVGPANGPHASLQFSERAVAVFGMDVVSARYFDEIALGGDGAGFGFTFGIQGAVGPRLRLTETLSLVLRPSVRASIRQEGGLYLSSFRIPGLETGFQVLDDRFEVDWVAHGAPLLTGVWATGPWSIPLGGSSWGTSASVSLYPVRFDFDLSAFVENSTGWNVLEVKGHLCSLTGKKMQLPTYRSGDSRRPVHTGPRAADYGFSICADFSNTRASEVGDARNFGSTWTASLSLLFGTFSILDPTPTSRLPSRRSTLAVESNEEKREEHHDP